MRVWERGSGITQACGTGACATAAAAVRTGRCQSQTAVAMDGGTLRMQWDGADSHIRMTGPAVQVFEGEIPDLVFIENTGQPQEMIENT